MYKTKKEVESWLNKYPIRNYTVNDDLTVDVHGSVYLDSCFRAQTKSEWLEEHESYYEHTDPEGQYVTTECDDGSYETNGSHYIFEEKKMEPFELPVQFNKVTGWFSISDNNLASLKGCPCEVGGDFNCSENNLTSLEGAPKKVGGDFNCEYNQLPSLKGAPRKHFGNFICSNNLIQSFEGAPLHIGGDFFIEHNQLKNLIGMPSVSGETYAKDNPIETLEGSPVAIIKKLFCDESCAFLNNDKKSIFSVCVTPERYIELRRPHTEREMLERQIAVSDYPDTKRKYDFSCFKGSPKELEVQQPSIKRRTMKI